MVTCVEERWVFPEVLVGLAELLEGGVRGDHHLPAPPAHPPLSADLKFVVLFYDGGPAKFIPRFYAVLIGTQSL